MVSSLKQELLEKIASTDDENILYLLNEDFNYFSKKEDEEDLANNLATDQLTELAAMAKEPFGHETESYEDFKKATARWRTK